MRAPFLFVLVGVALAASGVRAESYNRSLYPHWIDEDRDCQNTRAEALAEQSLIPVTWSDNGCRVITGLWHDPYTNQTFTQARSVDVDHVVPLKEAHISGAESWDRSRRRAFANDPKNLIAVSASANRSKGALDPAFWMPTNEQFRCAYAQAWSSVKERWGLSSDPAELKVLADAC